MSLCLGSYYYTCKSCDLSMEIGISPRMQRAYVLMNLIGLIAVRESKVSSLQVFPWAPYSRAECLGDIAF